jgi:integrase
MPPETKAFYEFGTFRCDPAGTPSPMRGQTGFAVAEIFTFRHTFSTLIKSLGVDAQVVQELMLHDSFRVTMVGYTQALNEPKRRAQERLADLIMQTRKVGQA